MPPDPDGEEPPSLAGAEVGGVTVVGVRGAWPRSGRFMGGVLGRGAPWIGTLSVRVETLPSQLVTRKVNAESPPSGGRTWTLTGPVPGTSSRSAGVTDQFPV